MGITFDNSNNMYIVEHTTANANSTVHKYALVAGTWTSQGSVSDNVLSTPRQGFYNAWGITWTEDNNRLLVTSFAEDCMALIDPTTMTYVGAAIPHVPGANAKAIDKVKECCYNGANVVNVSTCPNNTVYLRDLLVCDVCGGTWTPSSPPGTIGGTYSQCSQTFTPDGSSVSETFTFVADNDQCGAINLTVNIAIQDLSVTAVPTCTNGSDGSIAVTVNNGTAPYTYDWSDNSLDGTEDPTGLAAGSYTLTVTDNVGCAAPPVTSNVQTCCAITASPYAIESPCINGVAEANGAYILLSAVTTADRVGVVAGTSYGAGPDYNASTVIGALPFVVDTSLANPAGTQSYTLRFYDGPAGCTFDTTIVLNQQTCQLGCDCEEYLYANEVDLNETHKWIIDPATGGLTEIGTPWLPIAPPSPHGLARDINGNLYISGPGGGPVFRVACDGSNLSATPVIPNPINVPGLGSVNYGTSNFFSTDSVIYFPSPDAGDAIIAIDLCSANPLGYVEIEPGNNVLGWGFYIDDQNWYFTERRNGNVITGALDPTLFNSTGSNSGSILFNLQDGDPMGITRDIDGNWYVVENQEFAGRGDNIIINVSFG